MIQFKKYIPWILALLGLLAAVLTGLNPTVVKVPVPVQVERHTTETVHDTIVKEGRARVQLVHRSDTLIRQDSGIPGPHAQIPASAFYPLAAQADTDAFTHADYDTDITIPFGDSSWVRVAISAVYCMETQMYRISASALDWRLYALCPGVSETWTWIERGIAAALIIAAKIIK